MVKYSKKSLQDVATFFLSTYLIKGLQKYARNLILTMALELPAR
jgi:hypothetical protein